MFMLPSGMNQAVVLACIVRQSTKPHIITSLIALAKAPLYSLVTILVLERSVNSRRGISNRGAFSPQRFSNERDR